MNRYIAMKPKMRIVEAQNSCMQWGGTLSVDNAKKDKTSCFP